MIEPNLILRSFPAPNTPALTRAYYNLYVAENGSATQKRALGDLASLPRPWDPGTITNPQLRYETWMWLDAVVTWFNHEYVWNLSAGVVPPCWPQHPHLVHEIAVLADQRWKAQTAFGSDRLEEWHRYAVPTFLERLRQRLHDGCDPDHANWPAQSKYVRYTNGAGQRRDDFLADCQYVHNQTPPPPPSSKPTVGELSPGQTPAPPATVHASGATDPGRGRLGIVTEAGIVDPETGQVW